jgi:hypothetical protein
MNIAEHTLWDKTDIADYLRMSASHVSQRLLCQPGFPQAIRVPYQDRYTQPRWKAVEVIAWVEKFQEDRVA